MTSARLDLGRPTLSGNAFPHWRFDVLAMGWEPAGGVLTITMAADGVPSFTPALASDLALLCRSVAALPKDGPNIRWVVLRSGVEGIFSMGGDLAHFAACIESGDRAELEAYAHNATDVFHALWTGLGRGAVTVATVEGDALGGGYEAALVANVLVAEEGVRLGLPEVSFDIFPGMSAVSFLPRRMGEARAREFILAGKGVASEQVHAWGGVDVLVPPGGMGRWLDGNLRRGEAADAIRSAALGRVAAFAVSHAEMLAVVDAWVDNAMAVDTAGTGRMRRVADMQRKRMSKKIVAVT